MEFKNLKSILFIVNPNAGGRKTRRLLSKLEKFKSKIDICFTEYPKHGEEIVKAEFANYETFVAVGGDGTVNEIASCLVRTEKSLAIYPGGSGNGFAREFGFGRNVKRLIKSVENGKTLKADVIRLNGKPCFHFAGVGYDSEVAYDFSKRKGRKFWNYVVSTIKVIWRYKPIDARIEIKGEKITGKFFMVNIANNRQFGYHALIAPKANPTDGKIDLILVSSFNKLLFPFFSLRLFAGLLKPSKILKYITTSDEITIFTSKKMFHIDGEPKEMESPVKIEIVKGSLNVVDMGRVKFG